MPKVRCQERTYCILEDAINCIDCIHNLDPEQIHRGRRIKNFCNIHKEQLQNPNDSNFTLIMDKGEDSDEYKLHQKAISCRYYVPELMDIGFILNEGNYYPTEIDIEVSEVHAEGLNQVYNKFKPLKES